MGFQASWCDPVVVAWWVVGVWKCVIVVEGLKLCRVLWVGGEFTGGNEELHCLRDFILFDELHHFLPGLFLCGCGCGVVVQRIGCVVE